MRALFRNLISAAGLLLFAVGCLVGIAVGAIEAWQKIAGHVFSDGATEAVSLFLFGIVGGIAWLLASIDRRLEQAGSRN
jgi:hypothetical protein